MCDLLNRYTQGISDILLTTNGGYPKPVRDVGADIAVIRELPKTNKRLLRYNLFVRGELSKTHTTVSSSLFRRVSPFFEQCSYIPVKACGI
jgi:hypothetical protein